MRIEEYPRPKQDKGIGLLWTAPATALDPGYVLERARWVGAHWLVIPTTLDQPVSTAILRALVAAQVEVVMGIEEQVRPLPQADLRRDLQAYAQSGIRYLYLYREPNQMASWPRGARGEFLKPNLPQRFVDILAPSLQRVAELGMIPLLPPLAPGGDYWDLAFLADALQELGRREGLWVERLGLAIAHNISDRPVGWGRGGGSRWPQACPYHTPRGSEDHRGFHLFEWYDQIVRQQMGTSLPLIATGYPATAAEESWTEEVLAWARGGSRPEYLLLVNLGPVDQLVLSAPSRSSSSLEELPVIQDVASPSPAPVAARPLSAEELLWPDQPLADVEQYVPKGEGKSIEHYLLFPSWDWGISDWHWQLALNYVRRFRPTCGFDPHEAARARFVTLLGDGQGIDEAIERELRAQGCRVERIPGEDAAQIKRALDELARSGRRFMNQEDPHGR